MKILSDVIKSQSSDSISILFKKISNGISCLIGVSKNCKHVYNSKKIVSELIKKYGEWVYGDREVLRKKSKNNKNHKGKII